ncbi:MAG: hypothetical protein IJ874_03985 [Ruminococcus sp.]|nr:hypothetical protein [Ruminococcus sp.]
MANTNITRINKMGKACRIISRIAMVLSIIGAVVAIIGGCIMAAMPDDLVKFSGDVDAHMEIDVSDTFLADNEANFGDASISVDDGAVQITKDKIVIDDLLTLDITAKEISGNTGVITAGADLSQLSFRDMKREWTLNTFGAALICICAAVAAGFGVALSKVIEKCETPFSEDVIKKLKNFGWSLIPLAVFGGVADGSLLMMAVLVLAFIILINVFSYGVQLQQESDETL